MTLRVLPSPLPKQKQERSPNDKSKTTMQSRKTMRRYQHSDRSVGGAGKAYAKGYKKQM